MAPNANGQIENDTIVNSKDYKAIRAYSSLPVEDNNPFKWSRKHFLQTPLMPVPGLHWDGKLVIPVAAVNLVVSNPSAKSRSKKLNLVSLLFRSISPIIIISNAFSKAQTLETHLSDFVDIEASVDLSHD
ncbi:hypothetical protein KIN20_032000 [Parelaphostrongylus tenuis]|uniref:Uncharacterized protein n=1 Tax=Parelaphostrongylus tenuis TaxID=148309 RepID=A0AAD5R6A3_PARTN|nr:hypothetical protein KIN20_032000 [Parelaphostrongylus tenuis]